MMYVCNDFNQYSNNSFFALCVINSLILRDKSGFRFRELVELERRFLVDTHVPGPVCFYSRTTVLLRITHTSTITPIKTFFWLFAYASVLAPSPSIPQPPKDMLCFFFLVSW